MDSSWNIGSIGMAGPPLRGPSSTRLVAEPPLSPPVSAGPAPTASAQPLQPSPEPVAPATAPQIGSAGSDADRQEAAPKPPASLETLLMRFRLITAEQLDEALREKAATGKDVGAVVVERGWINEDQLSRLLSYAPSFSDEPTAPQPEAAPEVEPAPVAEFHVEPVTAEPWPEPEPVAEAAEPVPAWPAPELADPPAFPPALELIEPEPAPIALEPITPEPEPAVFEPEATSQPEPEAAPEPEPVAVVAEPAVEESEAAVPEPDSQVVRFVEPAAIETVARVFVRLSNGERVEAGSFDDMAAAKARAEEVVAQVSNPDNGWPFLTGRYIRPEAVLSVDLDATVVRYA